MVTLAGVPADLFVNGAQNLRDVLLMNGFHYGDMMGRTGANLSIILNGQGRFYMVGYTVLQYVVDGYPMMTLIDHQG